MLRNAKKDMKAIKKEMQFICSTYIDTTNQHVDDCIYEYLTVLNNRHSRIKNGSKGK